MSARDYHRSTSRRSHDAHDSLRGENHSRGRVPDERERSWTRSEWAERDARPERDEYQQYHRERQRDRGLDLLDRDRHVSVRRTHDHRSSLHSPEPYRRSSSSRAVATRGDERRPSKSSASYTDSSRQRERSQDAVDARAARSGSSGERDDLKTRAGSRVSTSAEERAHRISRRGDYRSDGICRDDLSTRRRVNGTLERTDDDKERRALRSSTAESSTAASGTPGPSAVASSIQPSPPTPAVSSQPSSPGTSLNTTNGQVPVEGQPPGTTATSATAKPDVNGDRPAAPPLPNIPEPALEDVPPPPPPPPSWSPSHSNKSVRGIERAEPEVSRAPTRSDNSAAPHESSGPSQHSRSVPAPRPDVKNDFIGVPTGPAADRKRPRVQQQQQHPGAWHASSSSFGQQAHVSSPHNASGSAIHASSQFSSPTGAAIPAGPRAYYRTDPSIPPPPPEAPPPPPEEELPPPPPLSFGHVPLPHELDIEENPKGRSYRITYDPALDKTVPKRGKEVLRRVVDPLSFAKGSPGIDPRLALPKGGRVAFTGRKRLRKEIYVLSWEWDSNSVGEKPPAPPRAFMVTGLSPLTTQLQISHHFRSFGRVEDCELKMDPQTGVSLGISWVRYAHDFDEDNKPTRSEPQQGHLVARTAVEATKGEKIGPSMVTLTFDDTRKTYVKTYRTELGKRYPPRKATKSATTTAKVAPQPAMAADHQSTPAQSTAPNPFDVAPPQSRFQPRDASAMPPPNAPTGPRADRMLAKTANYSTAMSLSYGAHLAAQAKAATPSSMSPSTPHHGMMTPLIVQAEISDTVKADPSAVGLGQGLSAANAPNEVKPEKKIKKVVVKPVDEDDMDLNSDDEEDFTAKTSLAVALQNQEIYAQGQGHGRVGFVRPDVYESTEDINRRLSKVGMPYVFVARNDSMPGHITSRAIRRHFNGFLPVFVATDEHGWYVAFNSQDAANRCKMVLDRGTLLGFRISIIVRNPAPVLPFNGNDAEGGGSAQLLPAHKQGKMRRWNPNEPPKVKKTWSDANLADEARDMIIRELAEVFLRDLKNRVVNPFVSDFLSPSGRGGRFLADPPSRLVGNMYNPALRRALASRDNDDPRDRREVEHERLSDGDDDMTAKLPSFRKVQQPRNSTKLEHRTLPVNPLLPRRPNFAARPALDIPLDERSDCASSDEMEGVFRTATPPPEPMDAYSLKRQAALLAFDSDESEDEKPLGKADSRTISATKVEADTARAAGEDILMDTAEVEVAPKRGKKATTKKAAAAKVKKGTKKAASKDVRERDVPKVVHTELKSMVDDTPVVKMGAVTAATLEDTRPRSPTPDPFLIGIAETEEDLYYAQVALSRLTMGQSVTADDLRDLAGVGVEEGDEEGDEARMTHTSGSARTEGHYRIPPSQKAAHLPDRNKATVDAGSTHALATARNNRADSRRIVLGLEQHKKDTATDTDILKFNQLRTRKKQLRFAKSPIHDWGLYAMELIPAGDMVIEYVGEVVRQQVADNREKQYERGGNFSTYLFRVDDDLVVDATRKGNIARLMNHCCTPNCTAKILTLNGEKRIVLYAKDTILPGQELTYDYKFQSSGDTEDLISCLCGSPGCRRFL